MKRLLKNIAVILICAICVFSLAGCDVVGSLRESLGQYEETGEGTYIVYNGCKYKSLPYDECLSPDFDYYKSLYIAEQKIPILLTPVLGTTYYISNDGVFLTDDYTSSYFCREDKYDEIIKQINNPDIMQYICYTHYAYSETDDTYIEKSILLNEEEMLAITQAYIESTPTVVTEYTKPDYEYCIELYLCSKDTLFTKFYAELILANDEYYILNYETSNILSYKIPENKKSTIAKIFDTVMLWDENYYEEF